MRLRSIDVYILDYFRRNARTSVPLGELKARCNTIGGCDFDGSIDRLEHEAHMLRRIGDGQERLELTREGRRYAGLAAAESSERFEPMEARE